MADNNITNVTDSLLKNMDKLISSKTVIGEPVKLDDAVIIPLVDVSFGVAAGSVSRDKKNSGAGGMNAKLTASAVLIIQNGHAKIMSVKNADSVRRIVDLIPEVMDKVKSRGAVTVDKEDAKDAAFPDDTEI